MAFEQLQEKLGDVFKRLRGHGRLTEQNIKEAMREVRLALLEADVNYKVVKDFVAKVSERAVGENVMESLTPAQQVIKIVNDELISLMGGAGSSKLTIASKPPTIIMLCGLQGAGKTTNGAKLAGLFKRQGKRPLLVACDVYRPAAIDQLRVVGGQLGVPVFEMGTANPVEIAKAALVHAQKHGNDMVFLDTAGRLHIDENLMGELKNIKKAVPVTEILLVVDSMTGQDAVTVAETFNEALGIDGIILTKTDGDARAGAALSVRAVTGKPIKFMGTGEKLDMIEPFHPDRVASRILGMGDMMTLIEKAQSAIDDKKAAELEKKLRTQRFTLNDFLSQMRDLKKMGSIQDILGMMPGIDKKAIAGAKVDEGQMARMEAIILSMTPAERENPSVLNFSRKKRIAAGSGTRVEHINSLIKQFDGMQKMIKQFSNPAGMKKLKGMRGGGFPF